MAASMAGTGPGGFELGPYFPDARACGPLLERAAALVAEGHRLEAANAPLGAALRPLLACMNACHASALEGRPLRPSDVACAGATVEADAKLGAALAVARAHVAAEAALSAALPQRSVGLYAPEFVQCIHAELHRRPASGGGERGRPVEVSADPAESPSPLGDAPGAWRRSPVDAARGAQPDQIPELLDLWQGVYSKPFPREQGVVAAICAGQRLLAVRPFERGTGRTARLHTQLVLAALGVTRGLWSPLRGMAKDRDSYRNLLRRALAAASEREAARREALGAYAAWLLVACLAEAQAARERLDPKRLEARLVDLLGWLGAHPWPIGSERSVVKPEAFEALHYAAITGPVERARFIAMLGLQHRTGRRVLSSLIDCGLLVSDSSRAPVRFNLPWPSLRLLFPDVWPEGASSHDAAPASPWPADARAAASGAHAIGLEALAAATESRSAAG
jgi:Fic family protein